MWNGNVCTLAEMTSKLTQIVLQSESNVTEAANALSVVRTVSSSYLLRVSQVLAQTVRSSLHRVPNFQPSQVFSCTFSCITCSKCWQHLQGINKCFLKMTEKKLHQDHNVVKHLSDISEQTINLRKEIKSTCRPAPGCRPQVNSSGVAKVKRVRHLSFRWQTETHDQLAVSCRSVRGKTDRAKKMYRWQRSLYIKLRTSQKDSQAVCLFADTVRKNEQREIHLALR